MNFDGRSYEELTPDERSVVDAVRQDLTLAREHNLCPLCVVAQFEDVNLFDVFVTSYVDAQTDEIDYEGFTHWFNQEFDADAELEWVDQHFAQHVLVQRTDKDAEEA